MEQKEITRKEQYLTAIAEGDTSKMPEKPLTREEELLEKIAKKPSTAVEPSVITDAVNDYLDEHPVSGADDNRVKELIEESQSYITPQMFGAKGDGVTDDTQALRDMFAEGKNVVFPRGVYYVTAQLIVKANILISGESRTSSVIKFAQNISFKPSDTPVCFDVRGAYNVQISNLGFVCEYEDMTAPHIDTEFSIISANGGSNVVIDNCWVKAVKPISRETKGIVLIYGKGARSLEVRNCLLQNHSNAKTGGSLWWLNYGDITKDGSRSYVGNKIIFENNEIEHTTWDEAIAIWTYNDVARPVFGDILINNNKITFGAFVTDGQGNLVNPAVSSNLISVNAHSDKAAWNYRNVTITNNTLVANYDTRCFIKLNNNHGITTVEGNYLEDNAPSRDYEYYNLQSCSLFQVYDCENVEIRRNHFVRMASDTTCIPCILLRGSCNINDNVFDFGDIDFRILQTAKITSQDYLDTIGKVVLNVNNNHIKGKRPTFNLSKADPTDISFTGNKIVNTFNEINFGGYAKINLVISKNEFAIPSWTRVYQAVDGGSLKLIDNVNFSTRAFLDAVTNPWSKLIVEGSSTQLEVARQQGGGVVTVTDDMLNTLATTHYVENDTVPSDIDFTGWEV